MKKVTDRQFKKYLKSLKTEDDWRKALIILWAIKNKFNKNKIETFCTNEVVSFTRPNNTKYAGKKIGIIIKLNPKRAKINVGVGNPRGVWIVPYSYLEKASKEEIFQLSIAKLSEKV